MAIHHYSDGEQHELPLEIARDLWVALIKKSERPAGAEFVFPRLSLVEQKIYDHLSERFAAHAALSDQRERQKLETGELVIERDGQRVVIGHFRPFASAIRVIERNGHREEASITWRTDKTGENIIEIGV